MDCRGAYSRTNGAIPPLPIWTALVIALLAVVGAVYDTRLLHGHHQKAAEQDAAIHRRLNTLDALAVEKRNNLLKRLYQVQSDVAGLTREHSLCRRG